MAVAIMHEDPFIPADSERPRLLEVMSRFDAPRRPQLTSPGGPPIELPETLYEILVQAVRELLAGHAVSILPSGLDLTTTQAAELLGVSRPFLTKLLTEGRIPFHLVGTHRRVRLEDVVTYRRARDAERARLLGAMIREADEAGLYDDFFTAVRHVKGSRDT